MGFREYIYTYFNYKVTVWVHVLYVAYLLGKTLQIVDQSARENKEWVACILQAVRILVGFKHPCSKLLDMTNFLAYT